MSTVEERPLPTDPTPASPSPAIRVAPSVRVDPARERPAQPAGRQTPLAPVAAATSTALSMASVRISRGEPTAREVAALALLLTARLRPPFRASDTRAS
ncbi:hypothetical protein [Streptomyces sp. NPDC046985]|uniref:hypothetical protein n=1 Tax=Streptomyces sp. NPDC046985 TaxID=3155377 RepID=UPI0033CD33B3